MQGQACVDVLIVLYILILINQMTQNEINLFYNPKYILNNLKG